ncbi:unnamed protein product [Ambrosiozyma monospora]|uniref:Unnamed protein product n=1 Tax=Ambrosiozyma monospora TaxID=43982 RepID=A0A9W7DH44_AMBMO|nr:unnamed protein product [Ambrosiozyma monospora]
MPSRTETERESASNSSNNREQESQWEFNDNIQSNDNGATNNNNTKHKKRKGNSRSRTAHPSMFTNRDTEILIIGTGPFGLSTALCLARQGYTNITCLERSTEIPATKASPNGRDMPHHLFSTKEYIGELDLATRLSYEAKQLWKFDPVFKRSYHPVGFMYAACDVAKLKRDVNPYLQYNADAVLLDTPEKIKRIVPIFEGDLKDWCAYFLHKDEGWVDVLESLRSAYLECVNLGVKFQLGEKGEVVQINTDSATGKVISVVSKSGDVYTADKYALCAGPGIAKLIKFQLQFKPRLFIDSLIRISAEEAERFRGHTVVDNVDRGVFYAPVEENDHYELKASSELYNFPSEEEYLKNPEAIDTEAKNKIRLFLRDAFPSFADRPFVHFKLSYVYESADRNVMLCYHPQFSNLVVAPSDSIMESFMLMPVIGSYIAKVINHGVESLSKEERELWKWRSII